MKQVTTLKNNMGNMLSMHILFQKTRERDKEKK